MKKVLFTIAAILIIGNVFSQANGDYQTRTGASGNWNGTTIWQQFVGGVWTDVATFPTSADGAIEVRSDANISVSVNVAVDQVTVSGALNILTGITLTVNNGALTDLTVAGTLTRTGTGAITYSASANGAVSATGTYIHNSSAAGGGTLTTFSWAIGSTCEVRGTGGGGTLGGVNQAFHHFKVNSTGFTGAHTCAGLLTTVNGDMTILSTNGQEFRLTASLAYTLNIGGSLIVTGGSLNTTSSTGAGIINIAGNLTVNGGIFITGNNSSSVTTVNVNGTAAGSTGSVTVSSGGITPASSAICTYNIAGDMTVSGGTVTLGGSGSANVLSTYFINGTVAGTTGKLTVSAGSFTTTTTSPWNITTVGDFVLSGSGVFTGSTGTSAGRNYNLSVGGNFSIASGTTFSITNTSSTGSTINFTGGAANATFNNAGTFTISGISGINVASGKTLTLNSDFSIPQVKNVFTVNGTLNCATNNIVGANGIFTLGAAGTLKIGSAAGISSNAGTGSIQSTGTRTFPTTANYEYNGSGAQVTGNQLPATVNSLVINNATGVGLTNSCAVTTSLNLQNGQLSLGASNISAASILNNTSSKYIVTDGAGALKLNSVGASNVLFPVGPSTTAYNPITINNAGTVDNFSVSVKPTFDNAPFDPALVVNMQWTVNKDGAATGNNVSLTPQWNASDEAGFPTPTFNRNGSLVLGHYGGGVWDEIAAGAVAGTYTTTATGVTSFSPFGVGNPGAFFNATPASVALNSANPAVPASNIGQGSTKQPVYAFDLAVTANAAILTQLDFTSASPYVAADITKFQLWQNTTPDLSTASQLGADITGTTGPGAHSFSGFSHGIANGATRYFWITADVAAPGVSTPGNSITVDALLVADLHLGTASKSGTAFASFPQTILAPTVTIASSNPSIPAGDIGQGAAKMPLFTFSAASANAQAILNQINFTTGGTYTATDVTRFQLWYSLTNNLAGATQLGTDLPAAGPGAQSFTALGRSINSGVTAYFWITADIAPAAVNNNTINVAAISTSDLTFLSGSINGGTFAGGTQTIIQPSNASDDFRAVANGDWAATSTWQSSPAGMGAWHTATLSPTSAATSLSIMGYSITVSTAVTVPNTTIDNTSTITITTGGSFAVGASKTVTMNGIITNAVTGTPITFGSGGVMNVGSSGVYNLTADGGHIPTATWHASSVINITGVVAAAAITNTANSTYGNYIYNCAGQTAPTMVLFTQAGINIAGSLIINSTGTGLAQIISSGGTNFLTVGHFVQHGGIAYFNPSNGSTTVRPMLVLGNFTIDDAVSSPTFRFSNGTAAAHVIVKGNVSLTNALIENTVTGGNSNFYFAGTNQTFSKTGGSTTVSGGAISFIVTSGSTVDLGTSIITGTNFTTSGPYTYAAITGNVTSGTNTITSVSSVAGLQPGMIITGTGIPANTYITSVGVIAASTIGISKNATSTAAGTALTLSSAAASTIKIGDAAGITSSGATGNIQVTGTRSFSAAGNYEYNGASAQVTGNGLPATENNLTINNAAGVTLSAATTTNGILALSNGVLSSDITNILTIGSTGNYTGGSTASHVSGPMNWNVPGMGSYTFPVGKGGVFHGCTVNPTASGSYQAEYFNAAYSDLTFDGTLTSISNLEYWDIKQLSGTSASVALSLNGTAIPGGTPTNLGVVAHWTGTTWTSENAGAISPGDATTGTALSNVFTSFSPFTFGTMPAPTPLTLVSFNGSINAGLVKLSWSTSNEINVRNFVIERSADGRTFGSIGTVNANNSAVTNYYNFNDPTALSGIVYYRLQMVDRDGKFKYSSVIAFNGKKGNALSIFPNPVKGDLFVTHAKATVGAAIQVVTMDGRRISSAIVAKDAVQTTLNTSALPVGVYQLVFVNGADIQHMRFIKQ